MLGRRALLVVAALLGWAGVGSAGLAHAFVPPPLAKKSVHEDPMITVAPASGQIPAPSTVAAPPLDAEVSASGLRSKVLRVGTGARPTDKDACVVHYTGWTPDGKMFDSSVVRKTPATFPPNAVIKGFAEGMLLMRVGEQRRLWIPGALGYGDAPKPHVPTGLLVFDIELVAIQK